MKYTNLGSLTPPSRRALSSSPTRARVRPHPGQKEPGVIVKTCKLSNKSHACTTAVTRSTTAGIDKGGPLPWEAVVRIHPGVDEAVKGAHHGPHRVPHRHLNEQNYTRRSGGTGVTGISLARGPLRCNSAPKRMPCDHEKKLVVQ